MDKAVLTCELHLKSVSDLVVIKLVKFKKKRYKICTVFDKENT